MATVTGTFSAGAWIVGGRMRHHRTHDHFGTELDTTVVLGSPIGKYPAGMTVADVLADLIGRLTSVESGTHRVFGFTAGAFIQPVFRANAVFFKARSLSFTANAVIDYGRTFTADSVFRVQRAGSFTADAMVV